MAFDTSLDLRNMVIYEVYVRNHGSSGKFSDVERDLDRIKGLGTDVIWFMPIHPIGILNKKGTLGCPYSVRDYRKVNDQYGTIEEFKSLIDRIHEKGMKAIIDIVFNHTSPDSQLYMDHPEYFYKKQDGKPGNKVGDWSDVIDLDYANINLWKEQIDTLKYWIDLGVDGFRCDVAPLIPLEFWMKARYEISGMKKDIIWLAESVSPDFIIELRNRGFTALSDSEIYNAFDIAYDYDVYSSFTGYLEGRNTLEEYLEKLKMQEYIYPWNYVKLRFLENHDRPRIKKIIIEGHKLRAWTAFMYFQKGAVLLYGGQEAQDTNTPSLFETDRVNWDGLNDNFTGYLKALKKIKNREILNRGSYTIHDTSKGCICASYEMDGLILAGIFNVEGRCGRIKTIFKDGIYKNLIGEGSVEITGGETELKDGAVIFEI